MRCAHKALSVLAIPLLVLPYLLSGSVHASDERTLVEDNSAFAFELYQKLRIAADNVFFSPYSISTALAMTYAGARGKTASQMREGMHLSLQQDKIHPAFSNLQTKLKNVQQKGNVELLIANSLWPSNRYPIRQEFLSLIKTVYEADITALDYLRQTEKARQTINEWVEDKTRDKIKEAIGPGLLDKETRLALVNAIYFKGNWEGQFDEEDTQDDSFKTSRKKTVTIPMMHQEGDFGYWADENLQILEMPYAGEDLSMLVLLPKDGDGLPELESNLTSKNLREWTSELREQEVDVWFPKFKLEYAFGLEEALKAMGMIDAFSDDADFSGMEETRELYISAALHKAFIEVNEEGTEAAGITGIVMERTSIVINPQFRADHPFVFLIQEKQTGSIVFMGRMNDPS
ncbi:MAG: serpin family protein [Gammaproteobacteria bacterium]